MADTPAVAAKGEAVTAAVVAYATVCAVAWAAAFAVAGVVGRI